LRAARITRIVADEHLVHEVKPLGGPVRELTSRDRSAYEQHLLALGLEDRRLRFGARAPARPSPSRTPAGTG
jgi:hypothetical protein